MGVWKKNGVVLAPSTADNTGSGLTGVFNQSVIYEGNAQILSGNVFKMWYFSGGGKAGYAESTDAVNWTRYNTDGYLSTLSGVFSVGTVSKWGSTYYMYGGISPWTVIKCYTSPDGIIWTLANATALSPGVGGHFDESTIYYLRPFDLTAGTYSASYVGINASNVTSTGIATSTSLTGNWTNATTAAVTNYGGFQVNKVGSTYYMWGSLSIRLPQQFPNTMARTSSTDLSTWTALKNVLSITQSYEGTGTSTGNIGPQNIVEAAGSTYMIYTVTTREDIGTSYQIAQASAPITISQLTQTLECEAGTQDYLLSDTMFRGSYPENPLSNSSNWTTQVNPMKVVGVGDCEATILSAVNEAVWTGSNLPNDQFVELTIKAMGVLDASHIPLLFVRGGATFAANSYQLNMPGGGGTTVYKNVSSAQTQIQTAMPTPANVDTWRLAVVGTTLTVSQNGVSQYSGATATDLSSGKGGFGIFTANVITDVKIASWRAGGAITYFIAGNVGQSGVTVTWSGAASGSTTSDSQGNYIIPTLAPGTYTITPTKTGVTFGPTSSVQAISSSNLPTVNFGTGGGGSGGMGQQLMGDESALGIRRFS